jgi:hypothetical protein
MIGATLASIVDTDALSKVIVASLVAGVGATVAFSLTILGAARFADMRRSDHALGTFLFATLTAVSLAVTVGMMVLGIIVMTTK